jgi:hypothetical protein
MPSEPRNECLDPERGWVPVEPIKTPRHWPWLQRIVDWLWRRWQH